MLDGGSVDRCIVGAVDSRANTRFLPAAARLGQLRTGDNPAGLIPGEAGAFFVLERLPDARRAGRPILAQIGKPVATREPVGLIDPERQPTGAGLAHVIRTALAASKAGFAVGDLNGSTRRAVEWGMARVRLASEHVVELPTWLPAMSFGDTGAASGAVGACLAARAFARGYAPARAALVWSSSESGLKSAFTISAVAE
jgi:3-oxoacyl-[acyl-carrier-protein] synthase-1